MNNLQSRETGLKVHFEFMLSNIDVYSFRFHSSELPCSSSCLIHSSVMIYFNSLNSSKYRPLRMTDIIATEPIIHLLSCVFIPLEMQSHTDTHTAHTKNIQLYEYKHKQKDNTHMCSANNNQLQTHRVVHICMQACTRST